MKAVLIDLTGKTFGRLKVISRVESKPNMVKWLCVCECGKERKVFSTHLRRGHTLSCGCWARDVNSARSKTHGMSKTRTYVAWRSMLNRCYREADKRYADYGGRGITVCEEWSKFEAFLEDMGECPDKMSLDRKNNNGNYEPSNCHWATKIQQANNKRSNAVFVVEGKSSTLKQLSREYGIPYRSLFWRVRYGKWSLDRALRP
jgi:hypothetical protein